MKRYAAPVGFTIFAVWIAVVAVLSASMHS
jgi:hypothetical protein